jgi:hypothetical protein
VPISIRLQRHFDLVNGIKGQKKENIAIIKTTVLSIDNVKKNGANCLIIINGTKQTEDNIIKIPLTKILSQVTRTSGHKKYGSEGKWGHGNYHWKTKESNLKISEVEDLGL